MEQQYGREEISKNESYNARNIHPLACLSDIPKVLEAKIKERQFALVISCLHILDAGANLAKVSIGYNNLFFQQTKSCKTKSCDSPKTESCDLPKTESCDSPKTESCDLPKTESCDSPKTESCDLPKTESCDSPRTESCNLPNAENCDSPKTESCDSSKTKSCDSSTSDTSDIDVIDSICGDDDITIEDIFIRRQTIGDDQGEAFEKQFYKMIIDEGIKELENTLEKKNYNAMIKQQSEYALVSSDTQSNLVSSHINMLVQEMGKTFLRLAIPPTATQEEIESIIEINTEFAVTLNCYVEKIHSAHEEGFDLSNVIYLTMNHPAFEKIFDNMSPYMKEEDEKAEVTTRNKCNIL